MLPVVAPNGRNSLPIFDVAVVDDSHGVVARTWEFVWYWSLESAEPSLEPFGKFAKEKCVGMSPNGDYFIFQKGDKLTIWNRPAQHVVATLAARKHRNCVIANDGRTIAYAPAKTAWVMDLATGKKIYKAHGGDRASVLLSPCGRYLATGWPQEVHDIHSQTQIATFKSHVGSFSADSRFGIGTGSNRVKLYDTTSGAERERLVAPFGPSSAKVSLCGNYVISAGGWGGLRVWEIPSEDIVSHRDRDPQASNYTRCVAFHSSKKRFATGTDSGGVLLWDFEAKQPMASLHVFGDFQKFQWIVMAPDGSFIASKKAASAGRYKDATTGKSLRFHQFKDKFNRPRKTTAAVKKFI